MSPKILDRLHDQLIAKGYSDDAARAIATKSLQRSGNLKPGTQQATEQGERRGAMSPEERERSRNKIKKLFKPRKGMSLPKLKF